MSDSSITTQTLNYVAGSTDPEQQLDLYLPTSQATSLIVFIHGGAWRTGSRKDHVDLAQYVSSKGKAVAVVDYRLSVKDEETGLTKHIHPVHAEDVNAALKFLHGRKDVPQNDWIVVGHSIGAWLALAAIIDGEPRAGNGEHPKPMPPPNSGARECIKTCVLVDGIYSVSNLLKEYPDYEGFVAQAFLPQPGPSNYDVVSCETWPLALQGKDFHVWHSRDDELLSFKQSIDAVLHLDRQLSGDASSGDASVEIPGDGLASTVVVDGEKRTIASVYGDVRIRSSDRLHVDLLSLSGAHDDLLHTETFWDLILGI
ncbi:alpha/beta hydrolase fold protein [Pseudozyma hubeiensis SY62]|uniref:Alpha/beta hydrolase fold protein n=1 Tax=Pseudozyma hubeiensis (strain SY62) TaxID=1305764 RepID=R9P5U3_PSEHS|nr:alpha/beta hydrolase fold protein [Pseudozyma hubeiensis SY62]GAC96699.1 alpha/beta hydrolase fold protein [Pseudozyma hubeiensis SY62]